MKRFVTAFFLASAQVSALSATPVFAKEATLAPEVSLDELKKIITDKSATLIDANGESTYKKGHIPGAVNYAQNAKNFQVVLPKDKGALVIAYCGGPLCTAWEDAAKAAKSLGYTNVKHFKGGIKGWKDAGQKVEQGS
jgi:rhodanese-related sulfurtransferase